MLNSQPPESTHVRVDAAGRVTIPAGLRQKLGIETGEKLILRQDEHGIHLQTFAQAVQDVQEVFAPYQVPGVSVVDELIREREEESRREYGE
jgi:AbrB family looped-hinge helix DNA binding protein